MAVKNPQFQINIRKNDITSRNFKTQCALTTYGVEEKVDLTPRGAGPHEEGLRQEGHAPGRLDHGEPERLVALGSIRNQELGIRNYDQSEGSQELEIMM